MSDATTLELLLVQVILVDGVWVAYAEDGTVLEDPDGVLLTGNTGAILASAALYEDLSLVPAGHWKHLFRPIRAADTPTMVVRGVTRVRFTLPETYDLRQAAETVFVAAKAKVKVFTLAPTTGAQSPAVRLRGVSKTRLRRPKSAARSPFVRGGAAHRAYTVAATAGCSTRTVGVRRKTFYTFPTPFTVQNPTEEMLYMLLAA